MAKTKTVLICPLDWGLGHATRMVPVIELLLQKKARVIIAADRSPLAFLRQRFPEVDSIRFEGFTPTYPAKGSMAFAMIRSYPKMMASAKEANLHLQEIIEQHKVDVVISDNRYELHSKKAYSVFVTHQLNIQTSGLWRMANPVIRKKVFNYIKQFDELWIPDFKWDPNLSGELSHIGAMPLKNAHFIGSLSRFASIAVEKTKKGPDLLVLLSGPEPQRGLLEKLLLQQSLESGLSTTILQGRPEESQIKTIKNVKLIPHLPDKEIATLIKNAEVVVSRPGYSTIMDLAALGKKAVFIPTPGQTEQEYLARRFLDEKFCYSERQKGFDLKRALGKISFFSGLSQKSDSSLLNTRIETVLAKS